MPNTTISVIIPTRKRFDMLLKAINSIAKTASTTEDIEFIIWFDEDDADSIKRIPELPSNLRIMPMIGKRYGYGKLYECLYQMFLKSSGEFIIGLPDDVEMLTYGWDLYIRKHLGQLCIIFPELEILAIVHRKIFETYGRIAEHYATDRIFKYIALSLGVYARYSALKIGWNYQNPNDPLQSEVEARYSDPSIKWYTWKEDSKHLDKLIEDLRPFAHPELFKDHISAEDVDRYYPLSPRY